MLRIHCLQPRFGLSEFGREPLAANLALHAQITKSCAIAPFRAGAVRPTAPTLRHSEQVKALDWKVRKEKKAVIPAEVMMRVRAKMKALLMISRVLHLSPENSMTSWRMCPNNAGRRLRAVQWNYG